LSASQATSIARPSARVGISRTCFPLMSETNSRPREMNASFLPSGDTPNAVTLPATLNSCSRGRGLFRNTSMDSRRDSCRATS